MGNVESSTERWFPPADKAALQEGQELASSLVPHLPTYLGTTPLTLSGWQPLVPKFCSESRDTTKQGCPGAAAAGAMVTITFS